MPGLGTIVNAAAIIVGGLLGLLFRKGIPERFRKIIFTGTGTAVFLMGATGVVAGAVTAASDGELNTRYSMVLVMSLVLGGLLGELLNINRWFERAGDFIKKCFSSTSVGSGDIGAGFAHATILFCSGAMAIMGAMEDVAGNSSILFTKAALDGITALIFTTAYGVGVILSGFSVLLYQGIISLLALFLMPYISPVVITQISMVGSAILMLIGFSLWEIKSFNVANMIPAAFMPVILSLLPF